MAAGILGKMTEKGIAENELAGMTASVFRDLWTAWEILWAAQSTWAGENLNIPNELRKHLKFGEEVLVKAANDANAAAFGEMWQGGGKGYKNLVAVTLEPVSAAGLLWMEKS